MKKFDTPEFNPHGVPLPSADFISFLDGEVYYIGALQNSECSRFIRLHENTVTYDFSQETKFVFRWKKTGYAICCAGDSDSALTLTETDESGKFIISAEPFNDRPEQVWEILPHTLPEGETEGICIRSSVRYSEKPVYLSRDRDIITASQNASDAAAFLLCPLSDWVTFGMAGMQYLRWAYYTDSDINKAFQNYYSNLRINISAENALMYRNTGLIVNQNGGNFPKLRFVNVFMNDVACEIIAVCNAIRIATGQFTDSNTDFFRLALEFELSGLYKNAFKKFIVSAGSALGIKPLAAVSTEAGGWGSDPDKIGSCLTAHNIPFKKIHIREQTSLSMQVKAVNAVRRADELIMNSKCAVISYRFSTLHQAIHTFACTFDKGRIRTFNRHSGHTPAGNYMNHGIADVLRGIYPTVSDIFIHSADSRFYVGYFIT